MAADVADFVRRNARVLQREFHTFLHGFFLRLGNVAAVAVGAVADEFGIDFRAAPFGVFQFFQHKNPCAFADDQAVATVVVRTRGQFGFAVAAAGGIE